MDHRKGLRHPIEVDQLLRGLQYDSKAVNIFLRYLSSTNPRLCKRQQEAIHDLNDPRLWHHLLCYLAIRRWDDLRVFDRSSDPKDLERIDQAIIEVFVQDEYQQECPIKDAVLHEALDDQSLPLRQAAACVLGQRNDSRAIPMLAEIIQKGSLKWKIRAVRALASLNEKACAQPLMDALVMDRGQLHREARRALQILGEQAAPVYVEALDHSDSHIRWEAARGLGEIGDTRAATTLAKGLFDESYLVRWASADVLAQMGECGVRATLDILSRNELEDLSRQSAIRALSGPKPQEMHDHIYPLLKCLRGAQGSFCAPQLAKQILIDWDKAMSCAIKE